MMFDSRRRERKRQRCWLEQPVYAAAAYVATTLVLNSQLTRADSSNNNQRQKSNENNKGFLNVQAFCRRNFVQVTALQLLCDTPGAYYYGSNAYRNSEVCMSGDKAKIEMDFTIPEQIKKDIIYMQIEIGLYDNFKTVGTQSVCSLPITLVKSFSNDSATYENNDDYYYNNGYGYSTPCPDPGRYHLSTFYSVPKIRDYNFHYTPDIRITFTDFEGRRIGCTATGAFSAHQDNNRHAQAGFIALGISVGIFIFIFGTLLYLSYRRKKRLQKIREQKQKLMQQQQSVQNQYFRTLPDGQVIQLPGQGQVHPHLQVQMPVSANTSVTTLEPGIKRHQQQSNHSSLPVHPESSGEDSEDESCDDALQISNPAYNETHLPTRPII